VVLKGQTGSHNEVADSAGGEDLPGSSRGHHPSRDVNGDAPDAVAAKLHLAGV
jgi:hypothetical protein